MNQQATRSSLIGKIVVVDGTRHTLKADTDPALLNDDRAICRAIAFAMSNPALAEAQVIPSTERIDGRDVPVITLRTQPPTKGQLLDLELFRRIPPTRSVDSGTIQLPRRLTIDQALRIDLAAYIDDTMRQSGETQLWHQLTNLNSVATDLDDGIGF